MSAAKALPSLLLYETITSHRTTIISSSHPHRVPSPAIKVVPPSRRPHHTPHKMFNSCNTSFPPSPAMHSVVHLPHSPPKLQLCVPLLPVSLSTTLAHSLVHLRPKAHIQASPGASRPDHPSARQPLIDFCLYDLPVIDIAYK